MERNAKIGRNMNLAVPGLSAEPEERPVAVDIPRALFVRLEAEGKNAGLAPEEIVLDAVSEKLAAIRGGEPKKKWL